MWAAAVAAPSHATGVAIASMSPAPWTSAPFRRAGNGTRTRDPNLGKVVLYQLSYSRVAT